MPDKMLCHLHKDLSLFIVTSFTKSYTGHELMKPLKVLITTDYPHHDDPLLVGTL